MIPAQSVLFGVALALVGGAIGVGQLRDDFPSQRVTVEARAVTEPLPPTPLANLCVTHAGFCTIRPTSMSDPCSCPHPLRGQIFGHAYSEAALVINPGLMPAAGADPDELKFSARP
jgi:hypothetical protein